MLYTRVIENYMKSNIIISIRNASSHDFGGGEKVPVQIAKIINSTSNNRVLIFSRNQKLLNYAATESVETKKTWWWSRQNWSGKKALLIPFFILWQIILTSYYSVLFIKYKPNTIHIQSKDDFIAGTIAAKILNINVIWSDYADLKHIFLNHNIWYKNPIGKMVYFSARFVKTIVVVSNEDKRLVLNNIPNTKLINKFKVIHFGSFDKYKKVTKNKKFTFVYSGRLVIDKGLGELIEAFSLLTKKHKDIQLHILGDGPDRIKFEEQSKALNNIYFFGHQQNPYDLISKSHVFILPTYHEGFSIALVEATMLQMPIIATNVGGNPEIIFNKKTGLLVKEKDSKSLSKAMDKLYTDKKLRDLISINARNQYIDKFQFDKIIEKSFLPLYENKN